MQLSARSDSNGLELSVGDIGIEVDPAEVGFDGARLARIDEHFSRYVDDGRLPG